MCGAPGVARQESSEGESCSHFTTTLARAACRCRPLGVQPVSRDVMTCREGMWVVCLRKRKFLIKGYIWGECHLIIALGEPKS